MDTAPRTPGVSLARAAGSTLGLIFGAAAAVRRTKPLHPRGAVVSARLERNGASGSWDVLWLDAVGTDEGVVRLSRAIGLPGSWPDVLGLAFSFSDETGRHDLLLATTGMGPLTRHLLTPRIHPLSAPYGSLFTYVTPRGHVVIAAAPTGRPGVFALLIAPVSKSWQRFGTLQLCNDPVTSQDELVDLDPVRNPLPGLALPPALAALREPAYAAARRMRPDSRE